MKTKKLAACLIAVITLSVFSCHWFSKSKTVTKNNIIGTWRVIDFWQGSKRDSTTNGITLKDSILILTFKADSNMLVFQTRSLNDTLPLTYYVDEHAQKIFVKILGAFEPYNVVSLQKDTLTVFTDDNKHIILTKQP